MGIVGIINLLHKGILTTNISLHYHANNKAYIVIPASRAKYLALRSQYLINFIIAMCMIFPSVNTDDFWFRIFHFKYNDGYCCMFDAL